MANNKNLSLDFLNGKTLLITGGTGSFGSNFARYLLANSKLKKLIILSRDEFKQSLLNEEFGHDERVRFFIGDIRDRDRLARAFQGVNIIVHAAALKQVPALEYNPFEAVKTNVLGTQNIIEEAVNNKVEKVLLISTDKAAQPVNLYGATKLCAEKLIVSGNSYGGNSTKFSAVRYGNVMGSRGSIIEKIIKTSDVSTVTITHEEMTRFWINLEQSFQLVLFALQNMQGGETFIPKIPSMKITDLFKALVPNAKHKISGIRPGEKIHEVLLTKEESHHALDVGNYYAVLPHSEWFDNKKRYAALFKMGKAVSSQFEYRSDNNDEWLSIGEVQKMIDKFREQIHGKQK
jgi:UDP-N-acetylglucosamine 4,6-dehydratase